MAKQYAEKVDNIRYKYYAKDEHPTLKGHTVHADVTYIDGDKIFKRHIILTYVDLVKTVLSKNDYFKGVGK